MLVVVVEAQVLAQVAVGALEVVDQRVLLVLQTLAEAVVDQMLV
jgi:hypothetical protein